MATELRSNVVFSRRVQQREIALRAGVSVSTVSRVLNNVAGISEELQERVRAVAQELGYVLVDEKTESLRHVMLVSSMSIFDPGAEPFYPGIVNGVEAECRRHSLQLSYTPVELQSAGKTMLLEKVQHQRVDGVLLMAIDDRALIEQLLASGLNIVLLNAEHPELAIDTFLPDNFYAPRRAVRLLIEHGHRRIVHMTSLDRLTMQHRHEAYKAALAAADIAFDPDMVIQTELNAASAYQAMQAFLAQTRDFSAVFCSNDAAAIGVLHALQEAGIRVPEDVSLIGYDDIPMAALLSPTLTTVRIEREELGALGVRRLLERSTHPNLTPIRVELACRLIERQSVADPRAT